ncbi:MAG: hypothetical protein K9I94_03395 [Bacteroidales bacterium]|nr:hypothetical protein [Bacteroidales bacterium]
MKNQLIGLLAILLTLLFVFPACETDFDVTADWEDVTVVYGLLNQNDTTHYIRISKGFLGEGNALHMAKEMDSLYYEEGALDATIEEWDANESGIVNTYELDRIITQNKEPGTFAYPEQVLYTFDAALNQDHIYKLVINNKERNKQVTARSPLVRDFTIEKPALNHPTEPTLYFPDNDYTKEVEWRTGRNGKRYEVVINFHYREQLSGEPVRDTFITWAGFPTKKADIVTGDNWTSEPMKFTIVNKSFYAFLEERIPYDDPGKESQVRGRYADSIEFVFSVAADEFNTYLELNNAASLVEERPEYTNINNGTGLFSARFQKSRTFILHPSTEALLTGEKYGYLQFIDE